MSDGKIVNDWIDADDLRRTAEKLLKPVEPKAAETTTTPDQDFAAFAETSGSTPAPVSKEREVAREALSKASTTTKEAGLTTPPRQDPFPPAPDKKPKTSPPTVVQPPSTTPPAKSVAQVNLPPKETSSPEEKKAELPSPTTPVTVTKPDPLPVVKPAPASAAESAKPPASKPDPVKMTESKSSTPPIIPDKPVVSQAPSLKLPVKSPFKLVKAPAAPADLARLPRSV